MTSSVPANQDQRRSGEAEPVAALVARLRELEAAASRAPWRLPVDAEEYDAPIYDADVQPICCSPDDGVRGGHSLADAEFIAALRNAAPQLLDAAAAVERVRSLCYEADLDTDGEYDPLIAASAVLAALEPDDA